VYFPSQSVSALRKRYFLLAKQCSSFEDTSEPCFKDPERYFSPCRLALFPQTQHQNPSLLLLVDCCCPCLHPPGMSGSSCSASWNRVLTALSPVLGFVAGERTHLPNVPSASTRHSFAFFSEGLFRIHPEVHTSLIDAARLRCQGVTSQPRD